MRTTHEIHKTRNHAGHHISDAAVCVVRQVVDVVKHLPMILLLTGCVTQPNYETGEDCWRTGVLQRGNTGRMTTTPVADIPVVTMNLGDLYAACDLPPPPPLAWSNRGKVETEGCYQPKTDTIYVLNTSKYGYVIEHEKCHALLGRKHNNCQGYGLGKDESACDWNEEVTYLSKN